MCCGTIITNLFMQAMFPTIKLMEIQSSPTTILLLLPIASLHLYQFHTILTLFNHLDLFHILKSHRSLLLPYITPLPQPYRTPHITILPPARISPHGPHPTVLTSTLVSTVGLLEFQTLIAPIQPCVASTAAPTPVSNHLLHLLFFHHTSLLLQLLPILQHIPSHCQYLHNLHLRPQLIVRLSPP